MSNNIDNQMVKNLKYEKAIGAMQGVAFGDALGWPFERGIPEFLKYW